VIPRKMRAGRYRVTLCETDAAGRRSRPLVFVMRVKKR
jgi:hypothetical protein